MPSPTVSSPQQLPPQISPPPIDYKKENLFWNNMVGQIDTSQFNNCGLVFGKLLGQGAFGQVWSGSIVDSNRKIIKKVVMKIALKPKNIPDIEKEYKQSNALISAIKQEIYKPNPENQNCDKNNPSVDLGKFQGADGIAYVLGKAFQNIQGHCSLIFSKENGNIIVEELVEGETLDDTFVSAARTIRIPPSVPYNTPGGYPSDLYGAIKRALALVSEVMAIHAAGYVHNDLKEANIMILHDTNGPSMPDDPPKIIDLGATQKVGERIPAYSENGGPEVTSKSSKNNILRDLKNKITMLETNLNKIKASPNSADPQSIEIIQKITSDINTISNTYNNILYAKSHPNYDIYSLGTVFPSILFGAQGLILSSSLFKNSSKQYLADLENIEKTEFVERIRYFYTKLSKLNNYMTKTQGKAYDDETIEDMAQLLAWMLMEEPYLRPTASQVFNQLLDMLDKYPSRNQKKPNTTH
jgi:serine/threonine protein kinase